MSSRPNSFEPSRLVAASRRRRIVQADDAESSGADLVVKCILVNAAYLKAIEPEVHPGSEEFECACIAPAPPVT